MYQRIIVPVDGSDTSNRALDAAIALAQPAGQLQLIHVVDELAYVNGYNEFGGYSGELIRFMRDSGRKILEESAARAKRQGIPAESLLFDLFGTRLGDAVAKAAADWNADLIVVGTHGRKGLGRVLLGSGAEQVIRQAPVPVLVMRAPAAPPA